MNTPLKRGHLFGISMLLISTGMCRAQQHLPFDLIQRLTEPTLARQMGLFSCGMIGADHRAAVALARLGEGALPSIEAELDAMEQRGDEGFGAGWLELVYARVKGRAAYARLRLLENDSRFSADQQFGDDASRRSLDGAIALSLGLTSYVSAPGGPDVRPSGSQQEPLMEIRCDRMKDPRDALTQLIRGFEQNDVFSFWAGLGPDAKVASAFLLKGTTWSDYRRQLLGGLSGALAVGYRFEDSGRWSEPDETLDEERAPAPTDESPVLKTLFTNASGTSCGNFQVRFELDQSKQKTRHLMPYLVNNSDLEGLLQVIASCAISR